VTVIVLLVMFTAGVTGVSAMLYLWLREKPYTPMERKSRIEELEEFRQYAIENSSSEVTLDEMDDLYHFKLKQIEKHK
jgi:hypothetical protein